MHPSHAADGPRAGVTTAGLAAVPVQAHLVRPAGSKDPDAVRITDVTLDHREAGPGVLFACRPGMRADGHDFAFAAVAAGSPALLVEHALELGVPQLVVPSVAAAVGPVAATVHGHPSEHLTLVGVTGTNGKTTTTHLIESVLRAAGHRTGLIGTVRTLVAGEPLPGVRTTPEATDLQRLLARMLDAGVRAAAMEVSSHGLALGRVAGTRFGVAVFTNLTRDHLDFHGGLEDYFAAKASLFAPGFTAHAVVNLDDPYGRRLAPLTAERGVEVIGTSVAGAADAGALARDLALAPDGSRFVVEPRWEGGEPVEVTLALPGGFNVANALQAFAACRLLGVPVEAIVRGLAGCAGVPGRMERVEAGQPFTVLVDYAHTPDSLEHVLRAARELTDGKVVTVIGCGGDRDRGKREPMGQVAAALADLAVLTSDNPRSEDPLAILDAMVTGARAGGGTWLLEPSRYDAIRLALDHAAPGDVVVLAGKGHETTQEFADVTVPFDDRLVARELLEQRWGGEA